MRLEKNVTVWITFLKMYHVEKKNETKGLKSIGTKR